MMRDECGMVSVALLALLAVMMLVGAGLLHFARNSVEMAEAARMETRLSLFAEGEVEREAERLKNGFGVPQTVGEEQVREEVLLEEMRTTIYVKKQTGGVEIVGVAKGNDAEGRLYYRKVQAWMEERDGHYVWKTWLSR